MKAVTVAATLVYGLSIAPTFAYFYDGNELWKNCNGNLDGRRGHCLGYIAAVVDSHEALRSKGEDFCIPSRAKLGQLIDVVNKYLTDNPQNRHEPAADLIIYSFANAFPCKR